MKVRLLVAALLLLTGLVVRTYEEDQRWRLREQEWCAAYSSTARAGFSADAGCFDYPDDGTGR